MVTRRRVMQLLSMTLVGSSAKPVMVLATTADKQTELGQAEAWDKAKQLSDKLLAGIDKAPRDLKRSYQEKPSIYIADVESSVDSFGFQLRYCIRRRLQMWSAEFRGSPPVPVKWSIPLDATWEQVNQAPYQYLDERGQSQWRYPQQEQASKTLDRFFDALFEFYGSAADTAFRNMGFTFRQLAPQIAKENFAKGLVEFLAARLSAARQRASTVDGHRVGVAGVHVGVGASPVSPGLPFRVFTQKNSLRVRYTKAYFPDINDPLVFGAPTSPVDGWMQPGIWRFATDGPGVPLLWDSGTFDIPPLREARLNI